MIQPGSQPMTLDANGDQSMDLLYELAGNGGIKVSLGSRADPTKWEQQDFFSTYVLSSSEAESCKNPNTKDSISLPDSNAFLDLNGDCIPDIVLTRQKSTGETYYEIYSQVFRNFSARDEAGIVAHDRLQRHSTILAFNFDRGKREQAETITPSVTSPHPRLEKTIINVFNF